jgi:serine/threonine protein kinase
MEFPIRLVSLISKSEKGEVWRGEHPLAGKVAVKSFQKGINEEYTKAEFEALDLLKNLRHPHLLQIHALFEHENKRFLVFELADGSLLDRWMQYKREVNELPVTDLLSYVRQVAECLDFLHDNKLVHGWVNPRHILLKGQSAKLADFILMHKLGGSVSPLLKASLKPPFLPHEIQEGNTSIHSDQYALASSYACLRAGQPQFDSTPPGNLLETVGKEETEVLLRAWSADPQRRFGNCTDFARELGNAVK